ncbi:MAG: hypothetical protein M0C28_19460 [Candidatus Moduliflexus flocculans]|nr:hypothetical protein [Candidatus Moduliflexus flocculans]
MAELKTFWDGYLNVLQVETPDAALNSNVNIHNPHQCYTTRQWSRYLSYYQLGMGARGIGIRDSSQDTARRSMAERSRRRRKDFLKTLLSLPAAGRLGFHFSSTRSRWKAAKATRSNAKTVRTITATTTCGAFWAITAYVKETGDCVVLG